VRGHRGECQLDAGGQLLELDAQRCGTLAAQDELHIVLQQRRDRSEVGIGGTVMLRRIGGGIGQVERRLAVRDHRNADGLARHARLDMHVDEPGRAFDRAVEAAGLARLADIERDAEGRFGGDRHMALGAGDGAEFRDGGPGVKAGAQAVLCVCR